MRSKGPMESSVIRSDVVTHGNQYLLVGMFVIGELQKSRKISDLLRVSYCVISHRLFMYSQINAEVKICTQMTSKTQRTHCLGVSNYIHAKIRLRVVVYLNVCGFK